MNGDSSVDRTVKTIRFFRSLLSGAFFFAYGAFALPFAVLLLLPWPSGFVRPFVRWFYRGFVFLAAVTGLYRVSLSREDRTLLKHLKGAVVVMNHISLIDICIIFAYLGDSTAIAKAAAKRNPFLALTVKRMFLVNDADPAATIAEAKRLLSKGVNIVVFPQGTRGGTKWHRGAARIALAAGAKIQPVRIAYDPIVLAKGQPWWDVGEKVIRISLKSAPEIAFDLPDDHRSAVVLTEWIENSLELKSRVL